MLETPSFELNPGRFSGRGAQLRYVPFEGEMSGMLYRDGDQIIIGINELESKKRKRFTIAHELGHLELHGSQKIHVDQDFRVLRRDENSSKAVDPEEIEANTFAADLLMPAAMLERDLAEKAVDFEYDEFIHKLAERYGVSLQAMIFRLTNLGYIAQAAGSST